MPTSQPTATAREDDQPRPPRGREVRRVGQHEAEVPRGLPHAPRLEALEPGGEVGDQIVGILEADVEPDERALPFAAGRGAHRVGRDRQALEAAPAVADAEQLEPVDQPRPRRRVAAVQDEGEEAGRALEVAAPILVAGAIGQRRMEDARTCGWSSSQCATLSALAWLALEPDAERAQAAQRQPGVVGAGGSGRAPGGSARAARERLGDGDRAEHQVGMAADIFGAGEDRQVDPGRDRREVEAASPRYCRAG